MDAEAIAEWMAALDTLSYYDFFRVDKDVTPDALRDGFHAFAEVFHPDSHHWRAADEQAAIGLIFRRGAEAYRVLADAELRARYDQALASGILRPDNLVHQHDAPRSRSTRPPGAAMPRSDQVRTPSARPFLLRAEELQKRGDPKQAKLQLVMAMHMDPGNPVLEAYAKELDEAVRAKGPSGPKPSAK